MAGQLLTALKTSGAKPTTSHEARLGIMVITILVFAFGFLVYHKMNLHQQNLTRAAIAPTGTKPPDVPPANPVAGIINQEASKATHDSFVNLANLSDGSPFSDSDVVLADPAPENRSVIESFDTLNEPVLTEPEGSRQADERASAQLASNQVPQLEPFEEGATTFMMGQPPLQPDLAVSDNHEIESPILAATPETPAGTNSSSSFPESTPAFVEIEEQTAMAQSDTSGEQPDSNEIAFDLSFGVPSSSEPEQDPEPVLLAMAEPQQSGGFDNGFLRQERGPTAKAPQGEPVDTPSSFAPHSEKATESAQQTHKSDSRGFNAVKNPGGRKAGNPIRTAAGSGSDGKFSLAAFNYQNGVSQSAPDDGSTYDSVVVQNGDNYTKISKRVYGTVKYFSALAVFNQHRIPEPKNMRPGMVVLVPAKEVLEERFSEFFIDSQPKTPEPAEFLLLDDGTPAYRVGERETISEISERFLGRSSRWIEIYRLNQSVVKDPNKLKAGLILALPADAAEVNVVP